MKTLCAAAAALVGCLVMAACEVQPGILFVADVGPENLIQLTNAQEECSAMQRLCYLTSWEGGTVRGCWRRERGVVHARFAEYPDMLIPVGEFRRTHEADAVLASLE
ncbi:MAG TPA: hypothetical protein VGI11_04120 [Variovorax sp.]